MSDPNAPSGSAPPPKVSADPATAPAGAAQPPAASTSTSAAGPSTPTPSSSDPKPPRPAVSEPRTRAQIMAETHPDLPMNSGPSMQVYHRDLHNLQVDRTYHPFGYGMSESLKRARAPFFLRNAIMGSGIFAFALGVYFYSISAVSQDDFSDIEDLLPPLEVRKTLTSIEDEEKGRVHGGPGPLGGAIPQDVSSGSSIAPPPPLLRSQGNYTMIDSKRYPAAWAFKAFTGRDVDTIAGDLPPISANVDRLGLMRQPTQHIRGPRQV